MTGDSIRLLGQTCLTDILNAALAHSKAEQTQVSLTIGDSGLTRFARSRIHQNVYEREAYLSVKAVIGKKIGFAATNSLNEKDIIATVDWAVSAARNQQENPDFVSLPEPVPMGDYAQTFFESTAAFSPEDRAGGVRALIAEADRRESEAAGALATYTGEFAVVSSLGVSAYAQRTAASLNTVMTSGTGFGAATKAAMDIDEINPSKIGDEAAARAFASRDPIAIEPGDYDVVLLPYAVAQLVEFLGILGLGALSVQEGRSFMCGKIGQRICSEQISIWDDGRDPRGIVIPFDAEGVPRRRVDLIVDGVANAVVYDSYTANKEGRESTGHMSGVGAQGIYGPMPANLFLSPGKATLDEMIAGTDRGILVSRFHYVNVLHPIQTIWTGMTRDGTFLIEKGKITAPVKNLRFTESALKTLSNVEMVGSEIRPVGWAWVLSGIACVPAIKTSGFRFTGVTEF